MRELIDELLKHPTNRNMQYINDLTSFIIDNKIENKDMLKDDTKIVDAYNRINKSFTVWDELTILETDEVFKLLHDFQSQSDQEKIKRLITIYAIFNYELIFKYETYNLIINDEL